MTRDDDQAGRQEPSDHQPPPDGEAGDATPTFVEEFMGLTIEWFDSVSAEDTPTPSSASEPGEADERPEATPGINDGWHDLPPGARPFTPDEMIPDRSFLISEFLPGPDDPGISYAEDDPDSPKARERRRLVEQNREIYETLPTDLRPELGERSADVDA
jgi:hypothetical protein